ncbi:hypothetical protein EZV62_019256 [Acer yangbiense]|uniref:DUF4283 domain-containing protein n=1 Tax=Acer yangbiense TaxID=1000413 RepID=A0A5C7HAI4_9ROSI|nr:hypothetical protein EZV62_019256 [Acer yangbiense]
MCVLSLLSMSLVDLVGLCENLSVMDVDGKVLEVSEEVQIDGVEDVDRSLVGRVLSGKKVNRDAFKSLIDQLWHPFGSVEIEMVGVNTFTFSFPNKDDRNRFWCRGLWHFGKHLIVLEKPVGAEEVKTLGFDRAELWVQIHDIPIMCMNRRTARWLAEQIGGVIEIPSDSRECWGQFLRVKILLDITKPLKRWLRLKLDKSDNIVVVGLKYKRLSDFCFVYGRIRHVVKECLGNPRAFTALKRQPVVRKFRFEQFWLKEKDLGSVIKDSWVENGLPDSG